MKYLTVLGVIIAFVLGGLFGLTAGINLNPDATVRFVPNWGSVGDWVSGVGALLAVVVAIWLADTQRKDNAEKLNLKCAVKPVSDASMIFGGKDLVVELISSGNRPVRVSGAQIGAKGKEGGWTAHMAGPTGKGFPFTLNYGEHEEIRLSFRDVSDVLEHFNSQHNGNLSNARARVFSTLGHWEVDVSDTLLELKKLRDKLSNN
ncbi:Asp23/Gls24 family envelope stress response protein [Pseudomonas botevensis]|uniref:hypothetical protein n=1 Tax=Pseudomonas botevensis TaxID=2842352 RepID=UPI001C3E73F8|nr:hypothetical protein [Pseudomonas botevensis]MBV4477871.1 hypothetical protein [Pseudomonas botevensis]